MIPCPSWSNCPPCYDPPILNLSSEAVDRPYYWLYQTIPTEPRLGENPTNPGNGGIGTDPTSPAIPPITTPGIITPPIVITDPNDDPINYYGNTPQAVHVSCGDGGAYYAFMAGGIVIDRSVLEANTVANSLLTNFAKANKFCLSKVSFPGCLYQSVFENLLLEGGTGPFFWTVLPGSTLPPGLTFDMDLLDSRNGLIYGIPTGAGTGTIYFRITDAFGNFLLKHINWSILGITTPSALPDATNGAPYGVNLIGDGGTGSYQFYLNSGLLPDGLQLDEVGLIYGTPNIADDEEFTFEVKIDDGIQACFYTFTINGHSY